MELNKFIRRWFSVEAHRYESGNFKYYQLMSTLFGAILLTSNVAAIKLVEIFGFTLTGGFFIFPFTYLINCTIVEVYGYKNARYAIWCGFIINIIFALFIKIVAHLPPSPHWHFNHEFLSILDRTSRIVFASLTSFLLSDFIISYFMAKHKTKHKGKHLFSRIIIGSLLSISIGVFLFVSIAFWKIIPDDVFIKLMLLAFIKKMSFQILFYPLTAYLIYALKRLEGIDAYDYNTDFTPFTLDNVYNLNEFRLQNSEG